MSADTLSGTSACSKAVTNDFTIEALKNYKEPLINNSLSSNQRMSSKADESGL